MSMFSLDMPLGQQSYLALGITYLTYVYTGITFKYAPGAHPGGHMFYIGLSYYITSGNNTCHALKSINH